MGDEFMKDLERGVKASPKYDPKELAKRSDLFKAILEWDSARFSGLEGVSWGDPLEEPKWKFKRWVPIEDSEYAAFKDDLAKLLITDEKGKLRRLVPKGSGYEMLEDRPRPKPSGHATTKDERLAEAFYRSLEEMEKMEREVLASRRKRKQRELLALKNQEELQVKEKERDMPKEKETCILNERERKRRLDDKAFAEEESEKEAMDKVDDAGGTMGPTSMQDHSHEGGSGRSCIGR